MSVRLDGQAGRERWRELLDRWKWRQRSGAIARRDRQLLRAVDDAAGELEREIASCRLNAVGEAELEAHYEERLLRRYAARLVEEVHSGARPAHLADRAQGAATKLLERAGRGDLTYFFEPGARREVCSVSRKRVRSTFHAIVRNLGHDQGRRARRLASLEESRLELTLADESLASDPEARAVEREGAALLRSAMDELGLAERDRLLLWLRYVEDHSPAEVAERLGTSPANVRQLALRRRRAIAGTMSRSEAGAVEGAGDDRGVRW